MKWFHPNLRGKLQKLFLNVSHYAFASIKMMHSANVFTHWTIHYMYLHFILDWTFCKISKCMLYSREHYLMYSIYCDMQTYTAIKLLSSSSSFSCMHKKFIRFISPKLKFLFQRKIMHLILKNTSSLYMSIYRVFTFRKLNLNSIFDFSWGRLIDTRLCNTNFNLRTIM